MLELNQKCVNCFENNLIPEWKNLPGAAAGATDTAKQQNHK